jgi:ABC-type transport system involved in cytochrome c biogenesis permease subunit
VLVALLATAFFGLAFLVSLTYLLTTRRRGLPPGSPGCGTVCPGRRIWTTRYRLTIVGFILWTFTLIAGAIWAAAPGAGSGVGRERGVDVHHLGALRRIPARHRHPRLGRHPRRLAVHRGFAAVLFNFGVVNVFFTGLHSYLDCDRPLRKDRS